MNHGEPASLPNSQFNKLKISCGIHTNTPKQVDSQNTEGKIMVAIKLFAWIESLEPIKG